MSCLVSELSRMSRLVQQTCVGSLLTRCMPAIKRRHHAHIQCCFRCICRQSSFACSELAQHEYRQAKHDTTWGCVGNWTGCGRVLSEVTALEREATLQHDACLQHLADAVRVTFKAHQLAGGLHAEGVELFDQIKRLARCSAHTQLKGLHMYIDSASYVLGHRFVSILQPDESCVCCSCG